MWNYLFIHLTGPVSNLRVKSMSAPLTFKVKYTKKQKTSEFHHDWVATEIMALKSLGMFITLLTSTEKLEQQQCTAPNKSVFWNDGIDKIFTDSIPFVILIFTIQLGSSPFVPKENYFVLNGNWWIVNEVVEHYIFKGLQIWFCKITRFAFNKSKIFFVINNLCHIHDSWKYWA